MAQAHIHTGPAQQVDEPHRSQGVAAERIEVRIRSHRGTAEHGAEELFEEAVRPAAVCRLLCSPSASVRGTVLLCGGEAGGEGAAVDLAGSRQRHLWDHLQLCGNRIGGQDRAQAFAQLSGIDRRPAGPLGRDSEGDQLTAAVSARTDEHGSLHHLGLCGQRIDDLPGLHPVAADLDLVVEPAEVFERPVEIAADEITGPIRDAVAQRRVDEGTAGAFGIAQIAQRHSVAGQPQFARQQSADRPPAADDMGAGARNRPADRQGGEVPFDDVAGRQGGGFGRSVAVDEHSGGIVLEEGPHMGC